MATREIGKKYVFAYSDCHTDPDGWVCCKKFRPHPYDIMHLKVVRKGEKVKGSIPGWWTGSKWEGLKILDSDQILYWKRDEEKTV